jgi:hypothetical protein
MRTTQQPLDSRTNQAQAMTSAIQTRQKVLAVFPAASGGLLMIGGALTPQGLDQPITTRATALKMLPIAAAHTNQLFLSNLLVIFGLAALGVSFAAMATLVRDRGALLATVSAVVGGFGALCGVIVNVLVGYNLGTTGIAHLSRDAAASYLVAAFTSAIGEGILVAYLAGLVIAALLIVIALWRSRRVPRWLPVLFGIGLPIGAAAPPGIVSVPLQLPVVVAFVTLATCIWQTAALPAPEMHEEGTRPGALFT